MAPDLLVVGHIVKDLIAGGWQAGGSVVYAAIQGQRLGLNVAAVTVCSSDVNPKAIVPHAGDEGSVHPHPNPLPEGEGINLPGMEWHVLHDDVTTTFENRYVDGQRQQRLPTIALPITLADIPEAWRIAPITFLAPVFHDLDPRLPAQLASKGRLVGLGAQGWLRRREGERVLPSNVEPAPAWLTGDAVFVSEEDVADPESVAVWRERVPIVVLTRADRGCTVWDDKGRHDLPAIESDAIDPTGAGDVFACAFLVRLHETGDTLAAARFAAAAAALNVREAGLGGIGSRAEIEALVQSQTRVSSR